MITRNDTNSIYLIGSTKISSELDRSFHAMNAGVKLTLDYKYDDPAEPIRFFFRSDQYPYMRYGIPGVWIFCGTTPDYHQESDVDEKADYAKMENDSGPTARQRGPQEREAWEQFKMHPARVGRPAVSGDSYGK